MIDSSDLDRRSRLVPLAVFLLLAAVFTTIWIYAGLQDRRRLRVQTHLTAELTATYLEEFVGTRLTLVERLGESTAAGRVFGREAFERRARALTERFAGYQAINWIDATGTIIQVVPAEENPGILGKNILDHPLASDIFRRSRQTGQPALTGPLELFQGKRGFASYFPTTRGEERGFVNGVFSVDTLVLDFVPQRTLDDYLLHLSDGGAPLFPTATKPLPECSLPYEVATTLAVGDRTWTLSMAPSPALIAANSSPGRDWFLLAGLGLALGVAVLTRSALLRRAASRRMAREQRLLESQVLQTQKMESLGRLAGGIAHDFNNLLTAMGASAELGLMSLENPSEAASYMEAILGVVDRGARLTRQLLSFARRDTQPERPVSLNDLLVESDPMIRRLVKESIALRVSPAELAWRTRIDPGHAEQVLLNLVTNADDATPEGGAITLSTRNETGDDGEFVVLTVRDSGEGMSPEVRARIFEPFYTTKGEEHGTGLGLATVYNITRRYDVRVEVESALGRGSTFSLWFRRTLEEPALARLPPPPPAPLGGTVLLVEDDPAVRTAVGRSLEAAGFELLLARDGREALALLGASGGERARVDAVVTDLSMPRMGGITLVETLRERYPALPVVITTGYSHGALGHEVLSTLQAVFLPKPFRPEQLIRKLSELIMRSSA